MSEPAQKIQASSALNMAGPYLSTEASCPYCAKLNVLGHLESYNSPAKPLDVCGHLLAIEWDDEGERWVEFAAPESSPAVPALAEAPAEAPQPAKPLSGRPHPLSDWLPLDEARRRLEAVGIDATLIDHFIDRARLNRVARAAQPDGSAHPVLAPVSAPVPAVEPA